MISIMDGVKALAPFTSNDSARPVFGKVWYIGKNLYATNTHIAAKLEMEHITVPDGNLQVFPIAKWAEPTTDGRFPQIERVVWDDDKVAHNYLEFKDDLYGKDGLVDKWIKAFTYLSTYKADYNAFTLAKKGNKLLAYGANSESKMGAMVQLANGNFVENKDADSWYFRAWNAVYWVNTMKAIKIVHPESFKIMFPRRWTDTIKIVADPLLIMLTPIRISKPNASIRYMLDTENLDFADFDKNFIFDVNNI